MNIVETIQDVQTRSIEQLKSAQEQILGYNEQLAGTVTDSMPELPDLPGPFESLPRLSELAESYFGLMGELYETNKQFTLRLLAPWEKAEAATK